MTRIVVIGGGFAGVKCAKALRNGLSKDQYQIILFASENHMVFHPLLAEVASASINPKDMAAPLRALLKDVPIQMEEISAIDLDRSEVSYDSFESGAKSLAYDQLVIACGNSANLAVIPGMADHAFPMKTVGDALALQFHIINQMEHAEICCDQDLRKRILTFVVVGGGFSGVEVAGEIHDFITRSARYYSNFSKSDITVILVHTRDQILPEVSSPLREFARKEMEKNGIQFLLNAGASYCTAEGVGLKDGRFIRAGTIVCTIGTRPSIIVDRLAVPKDRGRIQVNADMSIPGFNNAWAIGDCAAVPNACDGTLCPTTGQFAERQGTQVAYNLIARLQGRQTSPFRHRSLGVLCSIGGKSAVAEVMGAQFSGTLAWMAWRATYLFKLPSIWQQIGIGLTWLLGLWFPPALTALRTENSKKIGNAHFRATDWIFEKGEPANEFYVIKEGQVEIVNNDNGHEFVLSALGPGDFFGESSLMDNTVRQRSCRAKTDVELLVLGKHVFEEISSALQPMRTALADAIKRRQVSWEDQGELKAILETLPLTSLIEPVSSELLDQSATLADAVTKLNQGRLDALYVVDGDLKLEGLVTRTDLMVAVESSIKSPPPQRGSVPVKSFMLASPICATKQDSIISTLLTMREHGFKRMPVVVSQESKVLLGILRVENIIATAMGKLMK